MAVPIAGGWRAVQHYSPGYLGSTCFDIAVISADPAQSCGIDNVAAVPVGTENRSSYYVVDILWSNGLSIQPGYATPTANFRSADVRA